MLGMETNGQRAHKAYCMAVNPLIDADGAERIWETYAENLRAGWEAAAAALLPLRDVPNVWGAWCPSIDSLRLSRNRDEVESEVKEATARTVLIRFAGVECIDHQLVAYENAFKVKREAGKLDEKWAGDHSGVNY